jgi:prefoldin subunit 5
MEENKNSLTKMVNAEVSKAPINLLRTAVDVSIGRSLASLEVKNKALQKRYKEELEERDKTLKMFSEELAALNADAWEETYRPMIVNFVEMENVLPISLQCKVINRELNVVDINNPYPMVFDVKSFDYHTIFSMDIKDRKVGLFLETPRNIFAEYRPATEDSPSDFPFKARLLLIMVSTTKPNYGPAMLQASIAEVDGGIYYPEDNPFFEEINTCTEKLETLRKLRSKLLAQIADVRRASTSVESRFNELLIEEAGASELVTQADDFISSLSPDWAEVDEAIAEALK